MMQLYEHTEDYGKVLDIYERIREGKDVPLDKDFWKVVDTEYKRLEDDLKRYKDECIYEQVLDAKMAIKKIINDIIDVRVYKIFMVVWKGEEPPKWLSEPEYKFYNDLKALIDSFRAELVPSIFSNRRDLDD